MSDLVKLTITEDYVSHWSWWQGLRELIQNAVDTGNYRVEISSGCVDIVSSGGAIPISALLLGKTTKKDDNSTIGKFGEGMKLGFLVLKRLGAGLVMQNGNDTWRPVMVYDETFQTDVLAVEIENTGWKYSEGDVNIHISNIPETAISELKSKFAPLQDKEVVIENKKGKAYRKENKGGNCKLYVNGIFVTEVKGNFKFDYDFLPSAFVLDRDRDSANPFEVKYMASHLLAECADILLLSELALEDYDDLKEFSGRFEDFRKGKARNYYEEDGDPEKTLEETATQLFQERHGCNAFPISTLWGQKKTRLVTDLAIKKGYSPVTVNPALFQMLEDSFDIDSAIEGMVDFNALDYLEGFLKKYGRELRAKPRKNLERTVELLKVAEGKKDE